MLLYVWSGDDMTLLSEDVSLMKEPQKSGRWIALPLWNQKAMGQDMIEPGNKNCIPSLKNLVEVTGLSC